MFELSVALKYLIPRWRQLSVSIISLISVFVIALVVWLIVVFFSVTHGLEKSWVEKMLSVSAPLRIHPTKAYTNSYYYNIDSIAYASNYTLKSIGEKQHASSANPYDDTFDEELPDHLIIEEDEEGNPRDLVKELFSILATIDSLQPSEYEIGQAEIQIQLARGDEPQTLQQKSFVTGVDTSNPSLKKSVLKATPEDIDNLIKMSLISPKSTKEIPLRLSQSEQKNRLSTLINHTRDLQFETKESGLLLPRHFLNEKTKLSLLLVRDQTGDIAKVLIPKDPKHGETTLTGKELIALEKQIPLIVEGKVKGSATLDKARKLNATLTLQGNQLTGKISYESVNLIDGTLDILALLNETEDPVLLPKQFKEAGVRIGDLGQITYPALTPSGIQEMRLPQRVVGFYDPGIIPQGGLFILASKQTAHTIRRETGNEEMSNGINLHIDDLSQTEEIKNRLVQKLEERNLAPYFIVESYLDYPNAREILQQLKSERTLFTIISCVIILVACSNIISMLIILVNDKRKEIAILRAMGATSRSIATIFGLCGVVMGLIGSLLGITLAIYTLKHIDQLVALLSAIQGHNAFNPHFYGDTLPNEISKQALIFVLLTTGLLSLISGIVPALKASVQEPSTALRSEG